MMQVRQGVEKVRPGLYQRSAADPTPQPLKVTEEVQVVLADPQKVASALSLGLGAVQKALPLFVASPPQLMEGFVEIRSGLFDAVAMMISEDAKSHERFVSFRSTWNDTAKILPWMVGGLEQTMQAYREEGDVGSLMEILSETLDEFGNAVTAVLPSDLGHHVTELLAAMEEALGGFGEAMAAQAEGSTSMAIQRLYSGIRSATDNLLPEHIKSATAHVVVAGVLDAVFTDLSATVLEYQQLVSKSKVCWKEFVERERTRPSHCPTNYTWDGEHWCFQDEDFAAVSNDAVAGKATHGAVPALCHEGSDFHEKRGPWCYKDCPSGSEAAGARCKSMCTGAYPVTSPLMCGKSEGTIASAIAGMTAGTLKAGINIAMVIHESGVLGLGATVIPLVEAGKGFAHPKCPMATN